jgi:hypothetical protein
MQALLPAKGVPWMKKHVLQPSKKALRRFFINSNQEGWGKEEEQSSKWCTAKVDAAGRCKHTSCVKASFSILFLTGNTVMLLRRNQKLRLQAYCNTTLCMLLIYNNIYIVPML